MSEEKVNQPAATVGVQRVVNWLTMYGAKGDWIPTIFDMPEMWRLNSKRFKGFNLVFWWMYIVILPFVLTTTAFSLVEAFFRWWQKSPYRNHKDG